MEPLEDEGHHRERRKILEDRRSGHRISRFKFSDAQQFWVAAKSRTGSGVAPAVQQSWSSFSLFKHRKTLIASAAVRGADSGPP